MLCVFLFCFWILFIYLTEKERKSSQAGGEAEEEGEAGSQPPCPPATIQGAREPDMGLHLTTLTSSPEPKIKTQGLNPLNHPRTPKEF